MTSWGLSPDMIFVTGDVHDMDMGGEDQTWLRRHSGLTEMKCAVEYGEIAAKYGVPVTLFLTGKAARQEEEELSALVENEYVELGGHTWNALRPSWPHHLYKRFFGTFYGPSWYQRWDIEKTVEALENLTGERVVTWRTHGYRGTEATEKLLAQRGIEVVSDEVGPRKEVRQLNRGLLSVPINLPPDHEHVFHGKFDGSKEKESSGSRMKGLLRTLLGIERREKAFGESRLEKDAWWEWVRAELGERLNEPGFATFLLHPACMEILDGMEVLEEVFEFLSSRDTEFFSKARGGEI